MTFAAEQHEMVHATQRKSHCLFIVIYTPILCKKHFKTIFVTNYLKSVSLKIEPLYYIAMYCNGSIFNETDFI